MRMNMRSVCSSFGANGIKVRKRERPGEVHACVLRACPGAAVGPCKSLEALGPRSASALRDFGLDEAPSFQSFSTISTR
jgi:hypothetical protein